MGEKAYLIQILSQPRILVEHLPLERRQGRFSLRIDTVTIPVAVARRAIPIIVCETAGTGAALLRLLLCVIVAGRGFGEGRRRRVRRVVGVGHFERVDEARVGERLSCAIAFS